MPGAMYLEEGKPRSEEAGIVNGRRKETDTRDMSR